jgi:hypothetical protein
MLVPDKLGRLGGRNSIRTIYARGIECRQNVPSFWQQTSKWFRSHFPSQLPPSFITHTSILAAYLASLSPHTYSFSHFPAHTLLCTLGLFLPLQATMPEQGPLPSHDHKSMADSVLSLDSSLLTPPLSLNDDEHPPFKPLDSDNVSLSMKKSGRSAKQRRQLNLACASSGDVNEEQKKPTHAEHNLSHKSLPDLKKYTRPLTHPVLSEPKNHAWINQKLQQLSSERGRRSSNSLSFDSRQRPGLARRPRRWTVPSKSLPTHLVCFTNHMHAATLNKSSDEPSTATPAMIGLRRATTKREGPPSIAQTNITFFPPPKFSRTSTTLLSFLRIASQQSQERINCLNTNASMARSSDQSLVPSPPRRPSVTKESTRPWCSVTAEPAVTDVMVYSAREHDPTQQFDGPRYRRFSTKIVSPSSVHEIIWDENVTSGESSSTSSNISRNPTTSEKRTISSQSTKQSMAVEKLETQLRRDSSDPRRALPENPSELHRTLPTSLQSLLNFKFVEAKARTGNLTGLPRSRASPSYTAPRVNDEPSHTPRRKTQEEHADVCNDVESFPPLRCRTLPIPPERPAILEKGPQPDNPIYSNRASPMGSCIGQSRHMRRKSIANYCHHVERVKGLARPTDEHTPLLSQTGFDGTSWKANSQSSHPASCYQLTSAAEADRPDPLHTQPKKNIFHMHLRRFCEICEFRYHKKRITTLEREVQTLKETVSAMQDGKAKALKEAEGTSYGWFTRKKDGPQQYNAEEDAVDQSTWEPVGKATDRAIEGEN